jgi:hypothetical protein
MVLTLDACSHVGASSTEPLVQPSRRFDGLGSAAAGPTKSVSAIALAGECKEITRNRASHGIVVGFACQPQYL